MIGLLALHAVTGLAIIAFGARLGRRALLLGGVPPLVSVAWLAGHLPGILDGDVVTQETSWVPGLGLAVALRLDGFAALMALLVSGIGVLVFAYAVRYFSHPTETLGRLAGLLTLFAGAMLGLVLADDLLLLFTFWELTSVTSYLLIGNDHTEGRARAAALQALLITAAGGLAMLGGFVVLGQSAGTFRLSELLTTAPTGTAATIGLGLVLVGAFTKSAQYPFHSWLPGAMAAPTPVSAYLHSATMVKAGVYLLARFAPVYATVGIWRPVVLTVGLVTMVGGGIRALRQNDLKLLLAFGTISQLGFLTVVFGVGTPEAIEAGCVLLLAHGTFKAALFMVVGMIDHETGTRDLRELPVLGRAWRPAFGVTAVSAASMAGVPLFFGFVSKEGGYAALLDSGIGGAGLVVAGLVAGSILTVAYSARLVWGTFVAPRRRTGSPPADHAPAASFLAPAALLTLVTVVLGIRPGLLDDLVTVAGQSLDPAGRAAHLALWHGVNLPLVLSGLTIALGAGLWSISDRLFRVVPLSIPSGADGYLASLRAVNVIANRVTGIVQNGTLPIYTGVILLTAAVVPITALVLAGAWEGWPQLVDAPAHVPVAGVLIGSAMAAAVIRGRLSAVLFLGVTGYGMAALFVVQGAPDLALTQVAIETLFTVLFVLVLRRLPEGFERKVTPYSRPVRMVIAATVGSCVFAFALLAGQSRTAEGVSDEMVRRSLPDGDGRNVVNVILVDFRGLDTMGEITVLAVAGIGAVALARAGRRPRGLPGASAEPSSEGSGSG